jgi:hypothetical protein
VSVGGVLFGYFLDKQKVTKTSASAAPQRIKTSFKNLSSISNMPPLNKYFRCYTEDADVY